MLTQRLGSDTQKDPAFVDAFIEIVTANPGSCDEVWLATDYGYPGLDTHKAAATYLATAAEKLRKAGIRVSLQLSNSLGHGQYMSTRDCTGLVYEGSPVENMVGADGTVAGYAFCWYGKHFREYILTSLRDYVEKVQPYCVWVDDDLRAMNHAPVSHGCWCDDCIARFNAKYGSNFTREELVQEVNYGDLIWRERHITFLREGLADFTRAMGNVIHEASPTCRMGYQYGPYGTYTGYGNAFILDAMYETTGYPPCTRPGGGSYNDHSPATFVDKSECLDLSNRMLPDYVEDRRPEIESLPDIVYGKSIGGTCFETSYYLASGNNAMSYAILMNDYEPMSWHGEMLAAFSAHRAYWEKLSAGTKGTKQAGWTLAMPKEGWKYRNKDLFGYGSQYYSAGKPFRFLGISIAMKDDAAEDEVHLLSFANARAMTDAEIETLLARPVITDAETVKHLCNRGFALPVTAEGLDCSRLSERFTAHPVNRAAEGRRWSGQFGRSGGQTLVIQDDTKVEWLSEYVGQVPQDTPIEECIPMANSGIAKYKRLDKCASAIITTPGGGKWAVFAFDMWQRGVSTEKRDQYLEAAAYISGHRQPAEIRTSIQALLQSRINEKGQLTQASITNATVADSGPMVVQITNPVSANVTYMGQYAPETALPLSKTEVDGIYTVTIPNVKAWSVGTLFFG